MQIERMYAGQFSQPATGRISLLMKKQIKWWDNGDSRREICLCRHCLSPVISYAAKSYETEFDNHYICGLQQHWARASGEHVSI